MTITSQITIQRSASTTGLLDEAAQCIADYLHEMFGLQVMYDRANTILQVGDTCRIVLGTIDDPHIRAACDCLPTLSSQGYLLRRLDERTMILVGGSQQAAAWAAYEFAEFYGVRYLLHRDVVPRQNKSFYLPDLDKVYEPVHRIRAWRQICELATGPLMWSLDQQRFFITQLFKLKFNGILLSTWPAHPFVDFEVNGLRQQQFKLLFGQQIPIDENNIGRKHLIDAPLLTNPEFVGATSRDEMLQAGQRLIQGIIQHAKHYDMHVAISFSAFEFPKVFSPCLQQPSNTELQTGDLTCTEQGHLDNPGHLKLIAAQFEAYLSQFPDVDDLYFVLPEHPHAERYAATAWDELSRTCHIDQNLNYQTLLDSANNDHHTCGGPNEQRGRSNPPSVSYIFSTSS